MIALFQSISSSYKTMSGNKSGLRPVRRFNQSSVPRWVPVNKSFIALTRFVLQAAVERLGLIQAALTLGCLNHQGHRHVLLAEDVSDLFVAAAGGVEEFIISTQEANHSPFNGFDAQTTLSLPVNFATTERSPHRLGYLVVQMAPGVIADSALQQELTLVVDEIVRVISRYQSRYRSIHWYGDHCFWIGNSNALRQLDQRIDQLAKRNCPVLIRADKGTGKMIAARRLHDIRGSENAPFIESDCREWEPGEATTILQSLRSCAQDGTLFLRNLDALCARDLLALRHFCLEWMATSRSGQALGMVFSLSRAALDPVVIGLGWMMHFVEILHLPKLSEREEDLRDLVQFFMAQCNPGELPYLEESAWQLLTGYQFAHQVAGLKQLVCELVEHHQGQSITADLLLPRLAGY